MKFPHVKDQELSLRKKFVSDSQESISEVKAGMDSPAVRRKIEEDEINSRRGNEFSNSHSNALQEENQSFINNQTKQTHTLIAQQDVQLDGLSDAVGRLGK